MAKVLFIEDSAQWQDTLQQLLETAGHKLKRSTSFEAAIGVLSEREQFDAIVFDLRLGPKSESGDPYVWFDAFIQGIKARKLAIAPIIILTGIPITKQDMCKAFTKYRPYVFHFFEKGTLDPIDLLQAIRDAAESKSGKHMEGLPRVLAYALLVMAVVAAVFWILLRTVNQIADPKTQQTALQVGGTILVAFVVFVGILSRSEELQNITGKIKDLRP